MINYILPIYVSISKPWCWFWFKSLLIKETRFDELAASLMAACFLLQWRHNWMGAMASQITGLASVYSTVYSGADQRKHQSSASVAFVWGIHWSPVNSPTQRVSNADFFFHLMTSSCIGCDEAKPFNPHRNKAWYNWFRDMRVQLHERRG